MSDERQQAGRDDRSRGDERPEEIGTADEGSRAASEAPGPRDVDREMGGTASHRRASYADPIPPGDPDGVLGPRDEAPRDE